ncbi:unnamed protein product, partial [Vicia faba]
ITGFHPISILPPLCQTILVVKHQFGKRFVYKAPKFRALTRISRRPIKPIIFLWMDFFTLAYFDWLLIPLMFQAAIKSMVLKRFSPSSCILSFTRWVWFIHIQNKERILCIDDNPFLFLQIIPFSSSSNLLKTLMLVLFFLLWLNVRFDISLLPACPMFLALLSGMSNPFVMVANDWFPLIMHLVFHLPFLLIFKLDGIR